MNLPRLVYYIHKRKKNYVRKRVNFTEYKSYFTLKVDSNNTDDKAKGGVREN